MKKWLCLLTVLCLFAVPALAQEYNLSGADYTKDLGHEMEEFRKLFDLFYSMTSVTVLWDEDAPAGDDFVIVNATTTGADKMQFLYRKSTGKLYAAACLLEEKTSTTNEALYNASVTMGHNLSNITAVSFFMDIGYNAEIFTESAGLLQFEQSKVTNTFQMFDTLGQSEMEKGQLMNVAINGRVMTVYGRMQGEVLTAYLVYHASEEDTVSIPGFVHQ